MPDDKACAAADSLHWEVSRISLHPFTAPEAVEAIDWACQAHCSQDDRKGGRWAQGSHFASVLQSMISLLLQLVDVVSEDWATPALCVYVVGRLHGSWTLPSLPTTK